MDKIYWTMKNGKKINVNDMSESHLRNTLRMVNTNKDKNHWFVLTSNKNLKLLLLLNELSIDRLKTLLKDYILGKELPDGNITKQFKEDELTQAYYDSNTDIF